MPGRKHDHGEIVEKLRYVEELIDQGRSLADAIETIGVAEATYYRWRKELGTLSIDQMQRLKELELENARLRRAVLDLTIDKMTLLESLRACGYKRPGGGRRQFRDSVARLVVAARFDIEFGLGFPGRSAPDK